MCIKKWKSAYTCVENKLTLYPLNVGLKCLANVQPLEDEIIIQYIDNMIWLIGYIGLLSVEIMHSKYYNKFYLTEINLRDNGSNGLIYISMVSISPRTTLRVYSVFS